MQERITRDACCGTSANGDADQRFVQAREGEGGDRADHHRDDVVAAERGDRCRAGIAALEAGDTFYTQNLGIPPLREALAAYVSRLHRPTAPGEIVVTNSGMSALMLVTIDIDSKLPAMQLAGPRLMELCASEDAATAANAAQALRNASEHLDARYLLETGMAREDIVRFMGELPPAPQDYFIKYNLPH